MDPRTIAAIAGLVASVAGWHQAYMQHEEKMAAIVSKNREVERRQLAETDARYTDWALQEALSRLPITEDEAENGE